MAVIKWCIDMEGCTLLLETLVLIGLIGGWNSFTTVHNWYGWGFMRPTREKNYMSNNIEREGIEGIFLMSGGWQNQSPVWSSFVAHFMLTCGSVVKGSG